MVSTGPRFRGSGASVSARSVRAMELVGRACGVGPQIVREGRLWLPTPITCERRADGLKNRFPAPGTGLFTRFLGLPDRPEIRLSVLLFGRSETSVRPVRSGAHRPGCGTVAASFALRQRRRGGALIKKFVPWAPVPMRPEMSNQASCRTSCSCLRPPEAEGPGRHLASALSPM